MKNKSKYIFLILFILSLVFACKDGLDLREIIESDVKMHNNPKHTLSVYPTTGGTVSPGNDVEIVDELPTEITATAETGYAFKNWVFMEGEGFAVLERDVTDSSNTITVSGSDVLIQAVFVRQPMVISTYPQNSGIARNMPVRIVFSKIVDEESINSDTIQVFDVQQDKQITGTLEVNGSEVMFFASDSSLEQTAEGLYLWEANRSYQVFIRQNVLDIDGIALLEEESWAFSTGTEIDNTPPVISSFTIESPRGNNSYTNSTDIRLVFEAEDESMIPVRAVKFWNLGVSEPSTITLLSEVVDADGKIPFAIPSGDGVKQVNLKVYDMSNNEAEATAGITLDGFDPTLSSCALLDPDSSPHDADGFANTRNLSFQLSGSDDNSLESIGWVMDNAAGEKTWLDYTSDPVSISLPESEGLHTVYFTLRDEAGNLSDPDSDSIILDTSAPTGSVQVKGGAGWICDDDQNAALTFSCSDISLDNGEDIELSIEVESAGFSHAAVTRTYPADTSTTNITDVDLFPDAYAPSLEEEVTVRVRLIDVFGHERTVTDTFKLDFEDPTISSFILRSMDSNSLNSTTGCKPVFPNGPRIRFEINKADTGGSGLEAYRYDTNESGVEWSGWISDTGASTADTYTLIDRYGTKTVYIQVRDNAGNVSITATDDILNYYRAYLEHDRVYVSSNSEATGYAGEMYWNYTLEERATSGSGLVVVKSSVFDLPYTSYIQKGDDTYINQSEFSSIADYKYNYFRSSPPYSLRVYGNLKEYDTSSSIDISEVGYRDMYFGGAEGYYYLYTDNDSSMSDGNPRGYIRFQFYEND